METFLKINSAIEIPFSGGVESSEYVEIFAQEGGKNGRIVDPATGDPVSVWYSLGSEYDPKVHLQGVNHLLGFVANPKRQAWIYKEGGLWRLVIEGHGPYPCPTVEKAVEKFAQMGGEALVVRGKVVLPSNDPLKNLSSEQWEAMKKK